MIRILHIVTSMNRGGLETLLMNCFRHMDRKKVCFDFLVHRSFPGDYDEEIASLGGKIYRVPRLNPFHPGYHMALHRFFRAHPEYRIVHCHLDCMSALPLSAAKAQGVPVRIAHAHNASQDRDWKYPLKRLFMTQTPKYATHFFACSHTAGRWIFPGCQVSLLNNGIETERFRFSPVLRDSVRRELVLDSQLVIGHVGRFVPQKNHFLLMDIFARVHNLYPDSALLLVGEGPLEDALRRKTEHLVLTDCVHFLGVRTDVNRVLQAVDVFILPSLYEGLSLAAVEAQTCGLPCLISDTVSPECRLTDNVRFLSPKASAQVWADAVLETASLPRTSYHEAVAEAGFDIQQTADSLQSFYLKNW